MSRVLLCLGEAEMRQRLAAGLAPQHECLPLPPTGALEDLSFDLVLIDEAQSRLHPRLLLRDDTTRDRPAVLLILAPASNSGDRSALIDAADDFVFAPVQPLELSTRVERLLRARRAQLTTPEVGATEAALRKAEVRPAEIQSFAHAGSARLHVDGASGARSLQGVIVDVSEARWRALREAVATEMTELLVRDRPVQEFVERGAANFLRLFPNLACATVLTDAQSTAPSVAPSSNMPEDLRRFLEQPAFCDSLRQATSQANGPVVVEDIEAEPRCAQLRSQARAHGLRSCWFVPLVDSERQALGCFAVFSPRLGTPQAEELAMSVRGARLTSSVVERTRSLTLLRESEARLRALFDHAPLGVCLADREGKAFYANPALYALVGTPTHEPSMEWSSRVHPEDRTRVLENWQQLAQGQIASVDTMCRFLTTTGEVRTVRALANTVREGEAQRGVVATLEDVTERLMLEDQLRQAQKMEAMGRLAGGIAHDFNNLLAVMLNGLEALERIAAQDERELLRPLVETCERAAALTHQLLAFSRHQPIQRQTEDLRMIVEKVSALLQSLLGPQVTLLADLGSREAYAYVNTSMIEQVLMNLVINARDAMPQGGKVVLRLEASVASQRLRGVGQRPGATFHRISVSDTGTGIAKEDLQRIFEPFFTTKAEGKGTGLGLATVFGVVQQHGGWVEVESELGQGTSFHVYLPSTQTESEGIATTNATLPS